MSSKLKRKLNDLGINVSSQKANESFCLIGTPLPPLEKSKDLNEFVPLWKQEVRDDKGRRRLHGAFTGGFSAGYFNTVGSKEGWTPQAFISSRKDRAKAKVSRPEDFMDEEDLQELQDSKKLVDRAEEMDLTGGTEAELARRASAGEELEKDSLASALESAMLPAPKDSAGARILKKMGWKLGQGIGPRVSYLQRKLQDLQLSGRTPTENDLKLSPEEEEANKHTYPPRDIAVIKVERKDNAHGIGYMPGLDLHSSLGYGRDKSTSTGPRISAGFGLGALNEAEDDDVDVYDSGMDLGKRRTAYDHPEDEEPASSLIRKATGQRFSTSGTTFRDGTPVLPGFTLSDKPVAEDRWFPLPEVPKDWKPDPRRIWDADKRSGKENAPVAVKDTQLQGQRKWKTEITADERGSMLGEAPLSSAPRSVFDYMSQKDRERLQSISSNLQSGAQSLPSRSTPDIHIPHTEPHIADAALRGFQPFTSDPTKQARYTAYLQSQATPQNSTLTEKLRPLPGQNVDGFNKELEDYAKAALIFKPMSGAMAGRFTSAATVEMGPKIVEGLHKPVFHDDKQQKELRRRERGEEIQNTIDEENDRQEKGEERKANPKVYAAKMGMYGPLTREVKSWQPARLLCKRFGVKDPTFDPDLFESTGGTGAETSGNTGTPSVKGQEFFNAVGVPDLVPPNAWLRATGQKDGPRDLSNVGLGEDESQGRDILTYQRPTMDVFKAIFASDDEDSEDEERANDSETEAKGSPPTQEIDLVANIRENGNSSKNTDERVNLSTFKPTFIPRAKNKDKEKEYKDGDSRVGDDKEKDRAEKKKKKKDKERKSGLVSFAAEFNDEGGEGIEAERPKKKRRKDRDKERDRAGEGSALREKVKGGEEEKESDRNENKERSRDGDRSREQGKDVSMRNQERDRKRDRSKERGRHEKERRRYREEIVPQEEDESMWVEKEVPAFVKELATAPSSISLDRGDPTDSADERIAGPHRGRKRAIDFL
ncbi:hypothetical protein AX16_008135 [Volvariella volvacea WC 439]|nr:hypothetical protein AX16_008135 [Volvariella volvacea WC 439]